jgi:hypothetical protein
MSSPPSITGWQASPPTGKYVIRVPGKDDRVCRHFKEAVEVITAHRGYAVLIDPNGQAILTKGVPPQPDA